MNLIKLHNQTFRLLIDETKIQARIENLAQQINKDYQGKSVTLLVMLKGAFCFAADIMPLIDVPCTITFMRASSYKGMKSNSSVDILMNIDEEISGKNILIIEDIIDSGKTLFQLIPYIQQSNPLSLKIATLLLKPAALQYPIAAHYIGFEISDEFVVGYGLDYDELGRNLKSIYQLTQ